MKEKINQKGFVQIPLLVAVIVSIVAAAGIGYGVVEYNKTSNLVKESQQLAKEEKYNEAIEKLEFAQNRWLVKNLGIKRQEIANAVEKNKTLEEAKKAIEEAQRETEEEKARRVVAEAQLEFQRQLTQKQISELEYKRQEAKKQLAETETKLRIDQQLEIKHLLQDYYNEIRKLKDIGKEWWKYNYQNEVNFASYLARHDIAKAYWPEYEDKYHSYSGSYSYLDAEAKLNYAIFSPDTAGVNYNDSDYKKVNKILNFVYFYVEYQHDMNDILRAPVETLSFESGDCDDYSILVSAALADAGVNSAIMFVKSKDRTKTHAMVLFQSEEIFPLWSYSDLTYYDLPSGRWYIIEPQFTLEEHQQRPEWFAQWDIVAAALVKGIKNTIGGAGTKAKDAAIKANMDSMRLACEMFYTTNLTYTACSADPSYVNTKDAAVVNGAAFTEHIKTDGIAYCIQSTLPGGGDWCLDSKGAVGSAAITCDATNADCAAE